MELVIFRTQTLPDKLHFYSTVFPEAYFVFEQLNNFILKLNIDNANLHP